MDAIHLRVALPNDLSAWVHEQAREQGYADASDYVRKIIELEAERQKEQERIETLLQEGLDSGEPILTTQEYWDKRKQRILARCAAEQSA